MWIHVFFFQQPINKQYTPTQRIESNILFTNTIAPNDHYIVISPTGVCLKGARTILATAFLSWKAWKVKSRRNTVALLFHDDWKYEVVLQAKTYQRTANILNHDRNNTQLWNDSRSKTATSHTRARVQEGRWRKQ